MNWVRNTFSATATKLKPHTELCFRFGSFACLTPRTNVLHSLPIQCAYHNIGEFLTSMDYITFNCMYIQGFSLSIHSPIEGYLGWLQLMVFINNAKGERVFLYLFERIWEEQMNIWTLENLKYMFKVHIERQLEQSWRWGIQDQEPGLTPAFTLSSIYSFGIGLSLYVGYCYRLNWIL